MEIEVNKFVARQAILDRDKNTFAYELLYRNNYIDNYCVNETPQQATSRVIFHNHILGSINELCLNKYAFINFDEISFLADLPDILDNKLVVIELLNNIKITQKLISRVKHLCSKGYQFALDCYDFSADKSQLFPYVSYIKINIKNHSIEQISELINSKVIHAHNIKIIAERVETEDVFNTLRELGVHYYQGYFFHKPEIKSSYAIEPIKLNLLQLLAEVCQSDIDFDEVSDIISRDIILINGVLRLVNLESEQNRIEITSVKQAVVFLGVDKVKQYVAIVAMTNLSNDCPSELFIESLIRAKMMELTSANHRSFSNLKSVAFMTGLLSHIGAILKSPVPDIMNELPLALEIKQALIKRKGTLYELLALAKSFENLEVSLTSEILLDRHNVPKADLLDIYYESINWCISTGLQPA